MGELKFDSRRRRRVKYCPCGKNNRDGKFVPFVDFDDKGRCWSCGETFLPTKKKERELWRESEAWKTKYKPPEVTDYIPNEYLLRSLTYDNHFTDFLHSQFAHEKVGTVAKMYDLGTWQKDFGWPQWENAVCFWQIDKDQKIRQVKVMKYDPRTGKRVKEGGSYIVGKRLLKDVLLREPVLKQCFFGEHLLTKYPSKTVGIVESEKTAVIASIVFPKVIWLATGGSNGCSWSDRSTYKVLKGRSVIFYPDNDQLERWTQEVSECGIKTIARVSVCRKFYDNMNPGEEKYDLADYLLRSFEAGVSTSKTDLT